MRMVALALVCHALAAVPLAAQERRPPGLPPLAQVMDQAALAADLATVGHAWLPEKGEVVLSVQYDTVGVVARIRMVSGDVESERADSLLELVRSRLLRQPPVPADRPYRAFRLKLVAGDPVTFAIEASRSDVPRLLNRDEVQRLLQEQIRLGMRGEVVVELFVNEHGAVERSRVYQSSLNQTVDAVAIKVARATQFDPGRIDGYPVPVWVRMPVTFRVR
ncbi:MAG: energy transducer TonB [Gemmatimonadetes bacterium]|nr:energy transducer TonB [Gemmatimonadota bacterium]